jgi:hypothetical protein
MGQELGRDMYYTQLGRIGVNRFKRPVRKQKYQVMGTVCSRIQMVEIRKKKLVFNARLENSSGKRTPV